MCLLCVQWEKEKMTSKETLSALGEMLDTEEDEKKREHLYDLADRVINKEVPYSDMNSDYLEDMDFELSDED
jgi:hypothetical protein